MQRRRLTTGRLIFGSALGALNVLLAILGAPTAKAQLQFTDISATEEGAIRLAWQSESNTLYRIDYADNLVDPDLGYTVWQTLHDRYTSHGTNTFWLDTGNYFIENPIPHPKYTTNRFYRIVNEGLNTGEPPSVTITAPTSGATLSGTITVFVAATTSYPIITTKLFVDGEEMYMSDDGTNYDINTCEWPNGPHVLFATAEALSNYEAPIGPGPIDTGCAASAYVPVTFSNLISRVAFSQQFFQPSLGQTQQVTASFAANVNWTLQVLDENSNTVRTVTGSGGSMLFNWDGTGDGGVAIPDGLYNYAISAQTNGQSLLAEPPAGDGGSGLPPAPATATTFSTSTTASALFPRTAKQAIVAGLDYYYVQPPPRPPVHTNGQWIPWEAVHGPAQPTRIDISDSTRQRMLSSSPANTPSMQLPTDSPSPLDTTPAYSGPSSAATTAPTRPPTSPVKEKRGDYSVFYYSYPTQPSWPVPYWSASGFKTRIHLEGTLLSRPAPALPAALNQGGHFCQTMKKLGWKLAYDRHDDDLHVSNLRRADLGINGGELATYATIALFITHGTYGTDPDYAPGASGAKVTYFPSGNTSDGSDPWLRMCQFGLGGNLKWIAMPVCYYLTDPNFQDMVNHGAIPLKETHLICGASSYAAVGEDIGSFWAQNMIKKKQKVSDAWYAAGRKEYAGASNFTTPITFRVAGYPDCMDDDVQSTNSPANPSPAPGNLTKRDQQVWP
jgi:hypothetical protein